jgi:putative transposase
MPQSLSVVYLHCVFSTKERRPFLRDKSQRLALHAYLGDISQTLDCPPLIVGGVEDHVHLLTRFGRSLSQADWVKEIKRVSSLWLKEQSRDHASLAWQNGYADFSVSHSKLESVTRYIQNQEQHHLKMNFQDELRTLLRRHEAKWDERYLWIKTRCADTGVSTPAGLIFSFRWLPRVGARSSRQPWALR